jgi:hypothetical protein
VHLNDSTFYDSCVIVMCPVPQVALPLLQVLALPALQPPPDEPRSVHAAG